MHDITLLYLNVLLFAFGVTLRSVIFMLCLLSVRSLLNVIAELIKYSQNLFFARGGGGGLNKWLVLI